MSWRGVKSKIKRVFIRDRDWGPAGPAEGDECLTKQLLPKQFPPAFSNKHSFLLHNHLLLHRNTPTKKALTNHTTTAIEGRFWLDLSSRMVPVNTVI